uniref:Uncharacterized protein n=1 Tax=Octopus bimaculoides TaxID=37653 RepID=A0A0L8GVC3_OCTBM
MTQPTCASIENGHKKIMMILYYLNEHNSNGLVKNCWECMTINKCSEYLLAEHISICISLNTITIHATTMGELLCSHWTCLKQKLSLTFHSIIFKTNK